MLDNFINLNSPLAPPIKVPSALNSSLDGSVELEHEFKEIHPPIAVDNPLVNNNEYNTFCFFILSLIPLYYIKNGISFLDEKMAKKI